MSVQEKSAKPIPTYQVRLVNERNGLDQTLTVPGNEYILDMAKAAGIPLPSYCSIGCCGTCAGILVEGSINQHDQCYLFEPDLAAKFVLICVAMPTSDCTVRTHQQSALEALRATR